jgi:hypothetical protein
MNYENTFIEIQREYERMERRKEIEKRNKIIKDIAAMIKIILMSGCNEQTMNIMNNYVEDIKNLFLNKSDEFDLVSTLTYEDKFKMLIVLINLMTITTGKTIYLK